MRTVPIGQPVGTGAFPEHDERQRDKRRRRMKRMLKNTLATPLIALLVAAGTAAGEALAGVAGVDYVGPVQSNCSFGARVFEPEVVWGDNQNGNDWVEVEGFLFVHILSPGRCRLWIGYYDSDGDRVETDSRQVAHPLPTGVAWWTERGSTKTDVVRAIVCVQSRPWSGGSWSAKTCHSAWR
jgi:hypothetical protein